MKYKSFVFPIGATLVLVVIAAFLSHPIQGLGAETQLGTSFKFGGSIASAKFEHIAWEEMCWSTSELYSGVCIQHVCRCSSGCTANITLGKSKNDIEVDRRGYALVCGDVATFSSAPGQPYPYP
jgi:hypothetical protein